MLRTTSWARLTGFDAPTARRLVLGANAVVAVFLLARVPAWHLGLGGYHIDLDVYRIGARQWLRGDPLYGPLPRTAAGVGLPFTYPPLAAVLFSPLALLPYPVAAAFVTSAGIASLALTLHLFLGVGTSGRGVHRRRLLAAVLPVALLVEPARTTLRLGQVNLVLMALVAADILRREPRWRRGVLVGLAAAVKLTPAVFILFFLLRRDRRSAGTAALSFVGFGALGWLLDPSDSMTYWSRTVFDPGRIGGLDYAGNQSITAVLARLGLTGAGRSLCWLAIGVAVLVLAAAGMSRALTADRVGEALIINALAGLLISPVSWSHHWVWLEPAILLLYLRGRATGDRVALGGAGLGLALVVAAPQWHLPRTHDRELAWAGWQQVVGSSYLVFAVLLLCIAASRRPDRSSAPAASALKVLRRGAPMARRDPPGRGSALDRHDR